MKTGTHSGTRLPSPGTEGRVPFRHCPRDGTLLVPTRIDGRDRPACPVCGFADFMHVQIGANAVVERDGGVLLVRLNYGPRNGRWALPGGLVENDETAEEAARRETKEETGFDISLDGLLAAWMRPGFPIFVVVYRAHVIGGSPPPAPPPGPPTPVFPRQQGPPPPQPWWGSPPPRHAPQRALQ